MKSKSFRPRVFSYNATVLLIQPNPTQFITYAGKCNPTKPNPTHGWTQPMSISAMHAMQRVARVHLRQLNLVWLVKLPLLFCADVPLAGFTAYWLWRTDRDSDFQLQQIPQQQVGAASQSTLPLLTLLRCNNSTNCYNEFQRPHRCWPVANRLRILTACKSQRTEVTPPKCLFLWKYGTLSNTSFLGPTRVHNPNREREKSYSPQANNRCDNQNKLTVCGRLFCSVL